jgi:adenylylsulfate reductase, subunit B
MKAIETKIPYQLGYHGAKLVPFMGKGTITWICTDIYGKTEKFRYRNRITKSHDEDGHNET